MSDVAITKNQSTIRYRRWCFTIWKSERFPTKQSVAEYFTQNKINYCIIGAEITKTNEKPHFQCYCEWTNGRTFTSIQKDLNGCGHFTEAKGSCQQNIDYCSKEDKEPLQIGYANITNVNMSSGDIASNIVDLLLSFDDGQFPKLYELIYMYPQFSDYIVKNYRTLQDIYNDIKTDRRQLGYAEETPEDVPF